MSKKNDEEHAANKQLEEMMNSNGKQDDRYCWNKGSLP